MFHYSFFALKSYHSSRVNSVSVPLQLTPHSLVWKFKSSFNRSYWYQSCLRTSLISWYRLGPSTETRVTNLPKWGPCLNIAAVVFRAKRERGCHDSLGGDSPRQSRQPRESRQPYFKTKRRKIGTFIRSHNIGCYKRHNIFIFWEAIIIIIIKLRKWFFAK